MSDLSEEDVKKLALAISAQWGREVSAGPLNFRIDDEVHYQDHYRLRQLDQETIQQLVQLAKDYKAARGFMFKVWLRRVSLLSTGGFVAFNWDHIAKFFKG